MSNKKDLKPLMERLEVKFQDEDLLRQALVHRSYLNENPGFTLPHNERLEFLGDAVLELVVTDHLYHNYDLPEGELTSLRAAIVRGDMLSKISEEIGLDNFLMLSKGERKDTGKARQYIRANAVEAVIGAVYLDAGYEAAQGVIMKFIVSKLEYVIKEGLHIDAKSKFQELAQEKYKATPHYQVITEDGLDHAKHFVMGVYINERKMGEGEGSSKQEAQQQAARQALKNMENI